MNKEVAEAIRSRGEQHKSLFHTAFGMFEEAVREGDGEKAGRFRRVLLEAFDAAADDTTKLSAKLLEVKDAG